MPNTYKKCSQLFSNACKLSNNYTKEIITIKMILDTIISNNDYNTDNCDRTTYKIQWNGIMWQTAHNTRAKTSTFPHKKRTIRPCKTDAQTQRCRSNDDRGDNSEKRHYGRHRRPCCQWSASAHNWNQCLGLQTETDHHLHHSPSSTWITFDLELSILPFLTGMVSQTGFRKAKSGDRQPSLKSTNKL